MGILIKHSGNAAPTAAGAYGAGQGRRRAEDTRQATAIKSQREENAKNRSFQSTEAERARAAAAREREAADSRQLEATREGRDFQLRQTDDQRRWQAGREDLGLDRQLGLESLRNQNAGNTEETRRQNALSLAQEQSDLRKKEFASSLSDKAKDEWNRAWDAYEAEALSGKSTPEELDAFQDAIMANFAGLKDVPARMKKDSPYPEGQGIGESWLTEDGDFRGTRDDKGNIKWTATNANPTHKDIGDLMGQAVKALTTFDKDGAAVQPKPEEIDAFIERAIKLRQKYSGKQQPASGDSTAKLDPSKPLIEFDGGTQLMPDGQLLIPGDINAPDFALPPDQPPEQRATPEQLQGLQDRVRGLTATPPAAKNSGQAGVAPEGTTARLADGTIVVKRGGKWVRQ
jgi:hypothetical protein